MAKKATNSNVKLRSVDDMFTTEETRQEEKLEKIREIPLEELFPFKNHPFQVRDDEEMQKTVDSVVEYGVLTPAIVRPREEGGYEIVSGHRRFRAAQLAGLETLPAVMRELDDDAAVVLMVDSNLQREQILPSERAFAYKMKLEAIKHQGIKSNLTSRQVGEKLLSVSQVSSGTNSSERQIHRYIRLTELIPELLEMVDIKQMAFNPAVELSYLTKEEQKQLLEAMDYEQATPSLSQAQRLKKRSSMKNCSFEVMCKILSEEKKPEKDTVTIKQDVLRKYFPKSYTPRQMEETILSLLDQWQKRKMKEKSGNNITLS